MRRNIIDVHTHVFPDDLAARAIQHLSGNSGERAFTDGTAGGLQASMRRHGIALSVTQPVSTRPAQTPSINTYVMELKQPGLIHFGTLHPDYGNPDAEIERLAAGGIKGIKFHPDYQNFFVDEERMFPVYGRMARAGLIAFFHAGVDIGLPPPVHCPPDRLARVLERVPDLPVVAAHFGGFKMWDEVARHLVGKPLWLESSFTLSWLPAADFTRMARRHGIERVMFGTDSPWADQGAEIALMEKTGLNEAELDAVFHGSAARLLGL
ncbi:MAG TPA: amidohydrolase family protein [Kiritimatiellia bacterium]|nr:amidohydrolase family protein [Kiritimatiellia bacterium]HRZ13166.1 amidohydrolase family protein [Kiritimatiellia bacterium]HSA17587.1 amidohydrolase family protein [Kiritimatiellia bacterium]